MTNLISLVPQLAEVFLSKKRMLSTAESCTGGLIAAAITAVSGSSRWFERGFVTYSNAAKEQMLGVDPVLIKTYGAVSEEVAQAMAYGALTHSEAQVAVSVTGVAGPDGGSAKKPVGMVCFGFIFKGQSPQSEVYYLKGDRLSIRHQACEIALQGILDRIL